MASTQHNWSTVTAGMARAQASTPLALPISRDSEKPETDSAAGAGSDGSDNLAFLTRESKKSAPSTSPVLAGARIRGAEISCGEEGITAGEALRQIQAIREEVNPDA